MTNGMTNGMTPEQRLQDNIKKMLGEKEWLIIQLGTQLEALRDEQAQQPAPPADDAKPPFLRPVRHPMPAEETGS